MPTTEYPKNPNTDTAFVTDDNNHRTRAVKTVQMDGTIDYPSNPNSDSCYVTVDGKKQRALMVADISSAGTLDYPENSNSTKGYVTVNGKKQRVTLTASLVGGGGGTPVIDELNVTPSTSAQTITAPSGVDGYSPVNVSAVTSAIDANITSANIKSGVTILGVSGSVTELNGTTASVTPTTSAQTITPTAPVNGFTEVNVSAVTSAIDANITAGNIKKDVQILGVTGSYEGITPTGTKSITANGVYDVTDFASADVQVPTTAPEIYRVFRVNNGTIENSISTPFLPLPNTATDISAYCYNNAYKNTPASVLSGAIDLSGLTTISGSSACNAMFQGCAGIISIDLSSLTTVSGHSAFGAMFQDCVNLTSIDLSGLTTLSGQYACSAMFQGCTGIISIDLSSLTTVSATYACTKMFQDCVNLTSIDLSGLTTISGSSAFGAMFQGCTGITTVKFNALNTITQQISPSPTPMFGGSTHLESVEFGGLTASTFASRINQIAYLFNNTTGSQATNGCTVHFPSNFDPSDPNHTFDASTLTGYPTFGGSASYIHVAFDLPASEQ